MTLHISKVETREGLGVRLRQSSSAGTQDHWYNMASSRVIQKEQKHRVPWREAR